MRSPVLAVHAGESVQPLKWNLDGDTSLFRSLAECCLVGWWWIINNAVWRKGSTLPPLDSQNSCTLLSEQSSWSGWILSWRKDENSLCVERAEEATALILNSSSLLCVDFGFSGSQSSVPCPQSLAWLCFLILCTALSASLWPELCWLKLGATDSHLKWVRLKSLFNRSSTQVIAVTLALLTNEICGVWARKSGWFRHGLQDILPRHHLYMPTTDKRFLVMFKGGGEDRFTLENSKCCWDRLKPRAQRMSGCWCGRYLVLCGYNSSSVLPPQEDVGFISSSSHWRCFLFLSTALSSCYVRFWNIPVERPDQEWQTEQLPAETDIINEMWCHKKPVQKLPMKCVGSLLGSERAGHCCSDSVVFWIPAWMIFMWSKEPSHFTLPWGAPSDLHPSEIPVGKQKSWWQLWE